MLERHVSLCASSRPEMSQYRNNVYGLILKYFKVCLLASLKVNWISYRDVFALLNKWQKSHHPVHIIVIKTCSQPTAPDVHQWWVLHDGPVNHLPLHNSNGVLVPGCSLWVEVALLGSLQHAFIYTSLPILGEDLTHNQAKSGSTAENGDRTILHMGCWEKTTRKSGKERISGTFKF